MIFLIFFISFDCKIKCYFSQFPASYIFGNFAYKSCPQIGKTLWWICSGNIFRQRYKCCKFCTRLRTSWRRSTWCTTTSDQLTRRTHGDQYASQPTTSAWAYACKPCSPVQFRSESWQLWGSSQQLPLRQIPFPILAMHIFKIISVPSLSTQTCSVGLGPSCQGIQKVNSHRKQGAKPIQNGLLY